MKSTMNVSRYIKPIRKTGETVLSQKIINLPVNVNILIGIT